MSFVTEIKTFAALGTGVIGSGWVARALAHGLDVIAWDPAPGAEAALRERTAKAWGALTAQGLASGASQSRLKFVATVEECVAQADFIQESAPERQDLKLALHAQITAAARPNVLIGSSTSGLLPSDFYAHAKHPERCVVGHPFNPVYLLPLVEVVGGVNTSPEAIQAAMQVYRSLSMRPLHVRKEVPGFIADRLLGMRWSFMGSFLIYTLAGGDAGMRHFMAQFGPALKLPWTKLEAPELTDSLLDAVADGSQVQLDGRSIADWERYRDDCLMAVQAAVKATKLKHGIAPDA